MKRLSTQRACGLGAIVECLLEFKKNKISLDFCFFSSMEKKKRNKEKLYEIASQHSLAVFHV
tara:strand:+ start:9688 stop:9873 length:186 start_codon:yes stop_codon:yes gene_type:complete